MERGYLHIYCGDGKGKTTAAAGLAVRCAGGGGSVLWFQFLKKDTSGERNGLAKMEHIRLLSGYEKIKFTFQMTKEEKKEAAAFYKKKLEEITNIVQMQSFDLLILDEAVGAVNGGMIKEEALLEFLKNRPKGLEVVLTGRNPSDALLEKADYITEMVKRKHPYEKGVGARKKIEW